MNDIPNSFSGGPSVWMEGVLVQGGLWGDDEYVPTINAKRPRWSMTTPTFPSPAFTASSLARSSSLPLSYLGRYLLTDDVRYEGMEEIPCVEPCSISLPCDISGVDESIPHDAQMYGLHGFCHDKILTYKLHNMGKLVQKARHFHCAFALNFSVPMDAPRCAAIAAIWYNRASTIYLQRNGIPTIQSVSLTSAKFFDIAYDGLAPHCPVAFENMCSMHDPQQNHLLHIAVEKLVEKKSPTMLVIVGNHLNFDPQVPVKYYESRIQRLRRHGYDKQI